MATSDVMKRTLHRLMRRRHWRHSQTMKLTVRVWPDDLDGGFGVQCLQLPGCVSQGDTEEEALKNISDAIEAVLETMLEQVAGWQEDAREMPGHNHHVKIAIGA